jgi:uncharacterized protein YlxW (UPF0749 family)
VAAEPNLHEHDLDTKHDLDSKRVPRTTAMLDDLLNNPLDVGYRDAAASSRPRRWWERPAAWLGCLTIGFVLVVAYQQSHRSAPDIATARKDLIARIRSAQDQGNQADVSAKKLAATVAALRDAQLSATKNGVINKQLVRKQEIIAGAVPVSGPGVRVSLAEPISPSAANAIGVQTQQPDLDDGDIRAVVNQLWASGAEAIAVNGVRLTPTSSIRIAGQTILVDFLPISSPYSIDAVGPANTMLVDFADSPQARALQTKKAVDSISFSFDTVSKLDLPAGTLPALPLAELGSTPTAGASGSPP